MIRWVIVFCCAITFINGLSSAEECGHISNIKAVTVQDGAITVEFDFDLTYNDGVVQIIDVVDVNGERRNSAFGSIQVVQKGETLRWGDGDHVFHSLKLVNLSDKEAIVEVGFEHRPPAGLEHLAASESHQCQISSVAEKSD
jgi:hypothetical protein